MSALGALCWKEWRDARRLVIGSVIGSLAISVLVHWLLFDFLEGALVAEAVVPGLLGLFVAAIASDLIAGEVATGRIHALALLPIDIGRVWTAKLYFLLIASIAFGAWLLATQWVILSLMAPENAMDQFIVALPGTALPWLAATVAGGGAVLFFSTLIERGFAAVLSGCIALGAGYLFVRSVNVAYYGIQPQGWMIAIVLAIGAIAFVVGSRIAFTRGPIHHGHKARIGVVALAVVMAVLLPFGSGVAWAVHSWRDVEPGLASNLISRMSASPDGKYVAVEVTCNRGFWGKNWSKVGDYAARVWVIDLETSELREVEGRGTHLLYGHNETPWDEDGWLWVWTRESTAVEQDGTKIKDAQVVARTIDPARGVELVRRKIYQVPSPPMGPGPFGDRVDWAEKTYRGPIAGSDGMNRVEVVWKEKKISAPFECVRHTTAIPSREPGVVFYWPKEDELRRYELYSGRETVLLRGKRVPTYGSPDGMRLITWKDGKCVVLDAKTGAVVAGPFEGAFGSWHHGLGGHRYVTLTVTNQETGSAGVTTLVDLDTGREFELGRGTDRIGPTGGVLAKPSEDLLVTATGAGPIHLRSVDGEILKVLLAGPEGEE